MISSGPSIETLPEFTKNGLLIEQNVINDQTIANYCSDTVRELNNLTEELQHTDLHMGSRFNHYHNSNIENGTGTNKITEKHVYGDGGAINDLNEQRQTLQEITNHSMNNISQMNSNRVYESNCNGRNDIDTVDSSPFYTQLSQHLENNLSNFTNGGNRRSGSCDRSLTPADSIDGRIENGSIDGDEYRMATCMLQSVDLRGNNSSLT